MGALNHWKVVFSAVLLTVVLDSFKIALNWVFALFNHPLLFFHEFLQHSFLIILQLILLPFILDNIFGITLSKVFIIVRLLRLKQNLHLAFCKGNLFLTSVNVIDKVFAYFLPFSFSAISSFMFVLLLLVCKKMPKVELTVVDFLSTEFLAVKEMLP